MDIIRFFFAILLAASIPAQATTNCVSNPPIPTDYYMAIKGGISLGSYESGLNRILLRHIREQEECKGSQLISFSGASAGSINSLLSAVEYCYGDILPEEVKTPGVNAKEPIPTDDINNLMYRTWDIGIDDLLGKDANEKKDFGLFKKQKLNTTIEGIGTIIEKHKARKDCRMLITMSITRLDPLEYRLEKTNQIINIQRFVVPILVEANQGGKIKFRNLEFYSSDTASDTARLIPGPYLALPEDPDPESPDRGSIKFESVAQLALASSAFPVAFQPVPIAHCFNADLNQVTPKCTSVNAKKALFSDGGLFDNSPVGVARDLMKRKIWPNQRENRNKVMFFINPDHYRPSKNKIEQHELAPPVTALGEYAGYFFDSFSTATSSELKNALVEFENDHGITATPIVTTRFHNLLADFHAHFGAFYSRDFRTHDYLVGVYDGIYAIARQKCNHHPYESERQSCIKLELSEWIETKVLFPDEQQHSDYRDFLRYLFNMEFGAAKAIKNINIYIALAEGFPYSSKQKIGEFTLYTYINNLKRLLDETSDLRGKMDKSTTLYMIDNYHKWRSDKYSKAFRNIQELQNESTKCIDCESKRLNETIGSIVDFSEPIAASIFSHLETGVWPLAYRLNDRASWSFLAGYEFFESAPQYTLAGRYRIKPQASIDLSANFHDLSRDRSNDNYASLAAGATIHRSSILWSTWGVGYEYAPNANTVYNKPLGALYVSAGCMDEILSFKYLYRKNRIHGQTPMLRERNQFLIQMDVTKIIDLFLPLR